MRAALIGAATAQKKRVLIIAAEGGGGIGKRIKAYCRHHNVDIDDLEISVIVAAPNFLLKQDISDVVASVTAAGGFDVILVDTFAQVTPGGNENAGEDVGLALANARALREATGATIILVHHSGKDASKGARGWSGLRAAVDAEIEVLRHESGPREIRISKMKDGEDNISWGFKLEVVVLGQDADGDDITSCVVIEAEVPTANTPILGERTGVKKIGKIGLHILDMIEYHVDPSVLHMEYKAFIRMCAEGIPAPPEGKRDTRMQMVERAMKGLARGDEPSIIIQNNKVIFCK